MSKILEACKATREEKRKEADDKVLWLKKKYGRVRDEFVVPVEIQEYGECRVFKSDEVIVAEESSGPVIVCDEGEELSLSKNEWSVLARGPKFCVVRGCGEEDMRVELETAILKHKWDCMANEAEESSENMSDGERRENERVAQLAEEMRAQTRMAYNSEENVWDARGLSVTD